MTNGLAIFLLALIGALLALDHLVFHWDIITIVLRKLIELIRYIAFWR